jgi:thiol-disulfide isomerase/thioredoxin
VSRVQLVVLLLIAGMLPAAAPPPALRQSSGQVGDGCDPAAKTARLNFTLKNIDNAGVKLSEFKGKVIVLNFWATWCVPCKAEIPEFVELQERYRDSGVQFLGVSVDDTRKALVDYAGKVKISYPVLQGRGQDGMLDAFKVSSVPVTVTIARDGKICRTHAAPVAKDVLEREIKSLLD